MNNIERRKSGDRLNQDNLFQLVPAQKGPGRKSLVIGKKRIVVGRLQTCDVILSGADVTSIHAIIEIYGDKFHVYDMNSRNGTFVNGQKIVHQEFKIGDVLRFSTHEFIFREFVRDEAVPPVLDMLSTSEIDDKNEEPQNANKSLPLNTKEFPSEKPKILPSTKNIAPQIEYPLDRDPKADYCEYIFEDSNEIMPIFNYDRQDSSVEVIILFDDRIMSVDYLPAKNGVYKLVGAGASSRDIEYAYLAKKDKFPFIEIKNKNIFVNILPGYDLMRFTDKKITGKQDAGQISLEKSEIVRFLNGKIQIFVRGSEAPPKVRPAPLFSKDSEFKKYMFICLLFFMLGGAVLSMIEVNKEVLEEKVPERVATILYKEKKEPPKPKPVEQVVKMEPQKQAVQKAPTPVPEKKPVVETKKVATTTKAKAEKLPPIPDKKVVQKPIVSPKAGNSGKPNIRAAEQNVKVESQVSKGSVDTYKSQDFSSTMNSLLSKGGSAKSSRSVVTESGGVGTTGLAGSGESATALERAKVSGKVGSIAGAAQGRLEAGIGAEGIAEKKGSYMVGVPSDTVVLGSMDPDLIRKILMDHLPQFRSCYQRELEKAASNFSGVVPLDFVIGSTGAVTKAAVSNTDGDVPPQVIGCVLNVLRGIRFPQPLGGGVVEVKQPMNFRSSVQ